jgi:hypothetical protein
MVARGDTGDLDRAHHLDGDPMFRAFVFLLSGFLVSGEAPVAAGMIRWPGPPPIVGVRP